MAVRTALGASRWQLMRRTLVTTAVACVLPALWATQVNPVVVLPDE